MQNVSLVYLKLLQIIHAPLLPTSLLPLDNQSYGRVMIIDIRCTVLCKKSEWLQIRDAIWNLKVGSSGNCNISYYNIVYQPYASIKPWLIPETIFSHHVLKILTINKWCKDAHLQKSKTPTYFKRNEGVATRTYYIYISPVLLGLRRNLTSNKPTLFQNHTMVLLYFVHIIINQFIAHLSFPVTRAHSSTRNFLKLLYITPRAQNKPWMSVINQPPTCFLMSLCASASFENRRIMCTNIRPTTSDPSENTWMEITF